ncbi:hypothetical protein [Holdemania filiformis]|uniref:hypothetical protein n=1 Tax=Holdemania filiformis TaxID=61171 RepID=UPI00210B4937|nr:hypothetical protein [Holdemania filiformis]MCQ4952134.1 hypothetical protein [Holdemania filiformis]
MYSKIDSLFWRDQKNRKLSDDGKLLFLYLLTCPHRSSIGLYYLPEQYVASDIKWTLERVRKGFNELLQNGCVKYDRDNEIVFIKNFLRYNSFENSNQIRGAIKFLGTLPDTVFLSDLIEVIKMGYEDCSKDKSQDFKKALETLTITINERVRNTVAYNSNSNSSLYLNTFAPSSNDSTPDENTPELVPNDEEEPEEYAEVLQEPPLIMLPLNDGKEYPITTSMAEEWQQLYQATNVVTELRKMRGWLLADPERRKTKRGILRFVTNWLSRAQDSGSRGKSTQGRQDVLPDYYQQMKTGSDLATTEDADFDREEYEEIRRKLREQEEQKK